MVAQVVQMFPDPAVHTVRAVNLPDLNDKGMWLVTELRKRFPGQQDFHIMNWLRTIINTTDYHFVRTNGAFALSEVKRERMMSYPFVIDHFVLLQEGVDVSEGEALYDDMKRWAFAIGAIEIVINPGHVSKDQIEARIGKVKTREVRFVRVVP